MNATDWILKSFLMTTLVNVFAEYFSTLMPPTIGDTMPAAFTWRPRGAPDG